MTTSSTRPRPVRSGSRGHVSVGSAQERFEQRLSAKRRRMWKLVGALIVIGALATGGWWVLWRSDWLLVEKVVVTGSQARWEPEILAAADIAMNQPLVQVDSSATEESIREVTIVRDVQVVHSWPSTVTIRVTPREPVLAVAQGAGRFELVDADGVVIETAAQAPDSVHLVSAEGGSADREAYVAAWGVLSALPQSIAEQVTATSVTSAERVTLRLGERTVVWGSPQESELKARVAQALLAAGALRIDVSAPHSPVTQGTVLPPEAEEDGSDG